jgi:hypothetical protein
VEEGANLLNAMAEGTHFHQGAIRLRYLSVEEAICEMHLPHPAAGVYQVCTVVERRIKKFKKFLFWIHTRTRHVNTHARLVGGIILGHTKHSVHTLGLGVKTHDPRWGE